MAKKIPYGGLWNKERFKWMEEEKAEFLRNLTIEESVRIFESLTSCGFPDDLNDIYPDNPVCLRLALKKRKE